MNWLLGNDGFQFYTQPCENILSSVYGQHQRVVKPDVTIYSLLISFLCSLIASGLGTCLRPEIIFIFIKMRWCHHKLFRSYNYLRVVSLEQFQSSYSITATVWSSCWHLVLICAHASCMVLPSALAWGNQLCRVVTSCLYVCVCVGISVTLWLRGQVGTCGM